MLRAYVERLGAKMPDTVYVEAPFELQLGPHVVLGRLDRVDETPDGLEVVDYKTAEVPSESDGLPDTLQLDVYQLGLQALSGRLARRVSYYYLRSNQKVEFARDEADAGRTRGLLEEIARALEADWRFEPLPGPVCAGCPYTRHCPAVAERPRPLAHRRDGGQLRLDL
jgi:RecB family exonuclease